MARARRSDSSTSVGLRALFDAVHGAINFRESPGSEGLEAITRLLESPMMERLRRIKQLGYASHSYPSADHTRFGHAIGTLHIMRLMLRRLYAVDGLPPDLFTTLHTSFRRTFPTKSSDAQRERLTTHLLAAALVQDVGELPYGNATKPVYRPSQEMRRRVSNVTECDLTTWSNKDVFTIACLHDETNVKCAEGLNLDLLTFLITGYLRANAKVPPSLKALRHLLDGVIDADRLDYVYRDAHHTVGSRGSPLALIDALLYYDELGPVFADPVPVSEFLATRALLWTNVYFSPQNRFRTLLLTILLQGIVERAECATSFFGGDSRGELSTDEFLALDDVSLTTRIKDFNSAMVTRGSPLKGRLCARAKNALSVLVGETSDYECVWLSPGPDSDKKHTAPAIPDDLFFDTYSNYQDHSLYESGTVRIHSPRFQRVHSPIPLEDCSGPFNGMLKGRWSALPMPGSILLFMPQGPRTSAKLSAGMSDGSLYDTLMKNDPLNVAGFVTDTRAQGLKGPPIFISFTWDDIGVVEAVAEALRARRREYFLLGRRYQGLGGTPGGNSVKCVEEAGAILFVVSISYVSRFQAYPNGNIAKELYAAGPRYAQGLPIVALSVDDHREVVNFPSALFGLSEMLFVGEPLRRASKAAVEEAVDEALKHIDQAGRKR